MGQFQNLCGSLLFLALLIISSSHLIIATPLYYTMANLLTSWTNNPTPMNSSDDITFRTVLHAGAGSSNPQFFCGFYCNNSIGNSRPPQVVWWRIETILSRLMQQ
ncbi:unnamed protein product [Ilex paraguariensis]|uniref:Uncharacterized protein n=1 Tax=Ilex paraguariensis TaxID=185542 RepID=A0ABC8UKN2_9AQUA